MSYTKELELKIIRTKHKITFRGGTTAIMLTNYINQVPPNATVEECYEKEDGEYILTFHNEEVSPND